MSAFSRDGYTEQSVQICRALGLPEALVSSITLRFAADEIPTATITTELTQAQLDAIESSLSVAPPLLVKAL